MNEIKEKIKYSEEKKDMKNNNHNTVFHSFKEYFGVTPQSMRTKDTQKLESQREKFLGICPYCKQTTKYIWGTNIITCANEKCNGKKVTYKNEDGTETVKYIPFQRLISDKQMEIGCVIFDE